MKQIKKVFLVLLISIMMLRPNVVVDAAYGDYYYQENINVAGAKIELKGMTLHKTSIVVMDCGVDSDYYKIAKKKKTMASSIYLKSFEKYTDFLENEHGTMVNSIIDETIRKLGVQDKIKTIHLKWRNNIYEDENVVENFVKSIDLILKNKDKYNIKVVNFSADMDVSSEYEYKQIKKAIDRLNGAGIVFVAAAGNKNRLISKENSLSRLSSKIIFVGATDISNKKAIWNDGTIQYGSCTGKQLDLVAPGKEIDFGYQIGFFDYYSWNSGTSLSTPQVSVAVALISAINPDLKPGKVESILKTTAKNLGKQTNNRNDIYGYGLLNLEKAVKETIKSIKQS